MVSIYAMTVQAVGRIQFLLDPLRRVRSHVMNGLISTDEDYVMMVRAVGVILSRKGRPWPRKNRVPIGRINMVRGYAMMVRAAGVTRRLRSLAPLKNIRAMVPSPMSIPKVNGRLSMEICATMVRAAGLIRM